MINITPMTSDHVPYIAELEKVCFSDPWSENSIAYELTNPLSFWLVAMDGDKLVGYVGSQAVLDSADMMNIAVAPSHRRQGIARRLVSALVEQLKIKDVRMLLLEVRVSNDAARALYEEMGFVAAGKRPGYYTNPKEDALILRKEWSV